MSLSSSFQLLSFQRKVEEALRTVERTLELERKPRLAGDVDHTYGAKYALVNLITNAAIMAYMNCFEKLGLDASVLKSIDKTKPATLRFEASAGSNFLKKEEVEVPVCQRSYEEKEETKEETKDGDSPKTTTKSRVMKAVSHITEFYWEVEVDWVISIYSGTSVEDKKDIMSRKCKTTLITQTKGEPVGFTTLPPVELSLTWLLQQIDTAELNSQFKVDVEDTDTKTPRRNDAAQKAVDFAAQLGQWCRMIQQTFLKGLLWRTVHKHNPALPLPQPFTIKQLLGVKDQYSIFNPILPLMEEREPSDGDEASSGVEGRSIVGLQCLNGNDDDHKALLSSTDIAKLLNEHVRTLDESVSGIENAWPSSSSVDGILLSSSEATLSLLSSHLQDLSSQYTESMSYIESMMENQLIAAIGKRLNSSDVDKFVKYHNARLLRPAPQPFSHAIRRPEHYPVGLLCIESQDGENECIHTHTREVSFNENLNIPLSAATVLELSGQQYLHGYMNQRFGDSMKRHQLVARARQFSSFILVIGNMIDGSTLDPKDAIIVQNKDELLIPLLLEELPTAKEFKDAVKSLSPEQQRFAKAYRKMQLASSVFGICVIQIKPQFEVLLGLPPDALDKEMKLTQDLQELFIEYQVPSDLLSYNGFLEDVATEDKISNVRDNVKGVMDVVNAEKEKQLKTEQAKTDMAMEKAFQSAMVSDRGGEGGGAPPEASLFGRRGGGVGSARRAGAQSTAPRMMAAPMAMTFGSAAAPPPNEVADAFDSANFYMMEAEVSPSCSLSATTSRGMVPNKQKQKEKAIIPDAEKVTKPSGGEKGGQSTISSSDRGVDFTLIPQILDAAVEKSGEGNALRSTTIKTGEDWVRSRQENLLTGLKKQSLNAEDIKKEKHKAFDLLDALSRSGSLPIEYSELHVVVAATHCFDKDVMSTVICDNVNPIEKLEASTLLLGSAVHGVPARELVKDVTELQRLEGTLPLLLADPNPEGDGEGDSELHEI